MDWNEKDFELLRYDIHAFLDANPDDYGLSSSPLTNWHGGKSAPVELLLDADVILLQSGGRVLPLLGSDVIDDPDRFRADREQTLFLYIEADTDTDDDALALGTFVGIVMRHYGLDPAFQMLLDAMPDEE